MKRNPINPNKHEQDERPSRSTWVLLGLSGLFLVLTLLLMVLKDPASSWLPVHLH